MAIVATATLKTATPINGPLYMAGHIGPEETLSKLSVQSVWLLYPAADECCLIHYTLSQ